MGSANKYKSRVQIKDLEISTANIFYKAIYIYGRPYLQIMICRLFIIGKAEHYLQTMIYFIHCLFADPFRLFKEVLIKYKVVLGKLFTDGSYSNAFFNPRMDK